MRLRIWYAMAPAFLLAFSASAWAINIVPVFNNTDNETPAFDIFNQGIQDLFDYSETYFQDMLEDAGYTVTLNFWYEDLDGFLGVFNPVTTVGNRVTEANIRIDTRHDLGGAYRDWYIDSTPATDGEFEMEKYVWDTLDNSDKADWITQGSVPRGFEVGYRGPAVNGGQAHLKQDMLSTILHEIGHALGINSGAAENDDGDYDLNPTFIFGATVAAKIDTKDGQPDPGHMLPGTLLVCGECGLPSFRRRPSHADIFAMATSTGLTDIDVPRREFLGGGVFNLASNWSGNRTPDFNDDAYIRSADLVTMNASHATAGLTIINSTTLATGSNILTANGTVTLRSRFSNVAGKLVVGTGGQVNADDVVIEEGGELDMAGGTVDVSDDLFILEIQNCCLGIDAILSGNGTVNVASQVIGGGEIKPEGGTLTINAAILDLDGPDGLYGDTLINANTGSVVFNGVHTDAYDEEVEIGFAQLVTFNNAWTLGVDGDLTITDGGLINNAPWQADGTIIIDHPAPFGVVGVGGTGSMTVGATGNITTSGLVDFLGASTVEGSIHVTTEAARFSAGGTFTDSAVVTLDAGTTMNLIFANSYTIEGNATFTGPGSLVIAELATVLLEDNVALGTPLLNNGRAEIGSSPGKVAALAGFEQSSTGVVDFEIGGYLSGREFDFLDVTGSIATLAGTLELSLINSFIPDPGDSFEIIAADSVIGTFTTVIGADIGGGLMFEVVYSPTNVMVHVTGLPIPGDLDGDGFVGITDLNIVLGSWNQTVPPGNPLADPTNDGLVGIEDLNVVLSNWNAGIPPGDVTANIPEPAGATILVFGFTVVYSRRAGSRSGTRGASAPGS